MQMNVSRGDTIVTFGGVINKVIRSNQEDLLVEIADGVRVIVVRERVLSRRAKPSSDFTEDESVNDNAKKGSEGLKDVLTRK